MRRWAGTLAVGAMLALTAFPFVALFPQPPAFGRQSAAIFAAFAVLATVGRAFRTGELQRTRIARRAGILLAVTVVAVVLQMLAAGHLTVPTWDFLPKLFSLEDEDVDDAVLYEAWLEIWLACAFALLLVAAGRRALRRQPARPALSGPWDRAPAALWPRWNGPTLLLWLIGWAALGGAVVIGHGTASFLSGSMHLVGTIADPQPHPRIRFTAADGTVVQFTQNGFVSRALGAEVPVAYLTDDPAGTARADTFWANWSDVLGLVWVGLGFTLAPFFGYQGVFRLRRW